MKEMQAATPAPMVSVVVITRNRASSLARTLSALRQLDYPNYEVIVVDNGSTDNTAEVAREHQARYVFSPPESGISLTRQFGVEAARGEILAMCDDDCVPIREWLQHIVRRFREESDLGLLGGRVVNVGFSEGKQFKGRSKMTRNGVLAFVSNPKEAKFFGNLNLSARLDAVRAVGGYDPFLKAGLEEIDLAEKMRRHGYRVDYEPAAMVEHHFTGINYKRGRFFYDGHLMRLYFYLKHFRPKSLGEWLSFLGYETKLMARDLYRSARGFAASIVKGRFSRLPAQLLDLFNLISARLALPWIVWRVKKQNGTPNHPSNCPGALLHSQQS